MVVAIMDLKFQKIVVEILIEQHENVRLLTGDAWPLLKTSELPKMLSRLAAG